MLFGMQPLIELKTLEECAVLCSALNLDFIELNMNLPQYQTDAIDTEYLKEISDRYGIFYTIHLDENLNISDFNRYIAEGYVHTVEDTVRTAKALHIPIMNMHMPYGVYFTLPDRKVYLFSEYKDRYLESIYDFRKICEEAVGDSGIKICIENCNGFTDFQKEAIDILTESPVFGLTLDIGHSHSHGCVDEEYILNHKSKLNHMHMHDALGRKNHLTVGTGEIDIEKYLNLAKEQNCRAVLEVKTVEGLKQSVKYMREKGFLK